MILTPPPYRLGQIVQVQCPVCQEGRYLAWCGKYRRLSWTGRCRACAQKARVYDPQVGRRRYDRYRRQKEVRTEARFGRSWPEMVLECYYLRGYSLRETGQVLGISNNTIRTELVRWQLPRRSRGGDTRKYQRRVRLYDRT